MMRSGWMVCLWLVALCSDASAQLRLIDQAKIDSVRNPQVVEQTMMQIEGGTTVTMGSIAEDAEPWQTELRWRNRGNMPLVITRVVTTCGCLKMAYDRRPVPADSTARLRLEYHPKGHPGAVYQRVMIYTNQATDRPTTILTLSGEVIPAPDMEESYPATCGALRLRSTEVKFSSKGGRQTINLACYNGGEEALRLSTDTLLTSPALRIHAEPAVLQPGEEGELIVQFDPSKAVFIQPTMHLYLGGLRVTPRQRQLTVSIE